MSALIGKCYLVVKVELLHLEEIKVYILLCFTVLFCGMLCCVVLWHVVLCKEGQDTWCCLSSSSQDIMTTLSLLEIEEGWQETPCSIRVEREVTP